MNKLLQYGNPPLLITIFSAILTMSAMKIIGVQQTDNANDNFAHVEQIHEFKQHLSKIVQNLNNIENGLIGFKISSKSNYRSSTKTAIANIHEEINNIIQNYSASLKTKKSQQYLDNLTSLEVHIRTYTSEVDKLLQLDNSTELNINDINSRDQIQKFLNEINTIANSEIYSHVIKSRENINDVRISSLMGIIADFSLIALILLLIHKENKKKRDYSQQLEQIVYYDTMTGLPNRRMVFNPPTPEAFFGKQKSDQFSAVILLDLDFFNSINDTMGPGVGDKIIIQTSHRLLKSYVQKSMFARFGGDEFLIFLPELSTNQYKAKDIVERYCAHLVDEFKQPFKLSMNDPFSEYIVTASIGATLLKGNCSEMVPDSFIHQADLALYNSKTGGRSTYSLYNDEMFTFVNEQIEFEKRVKRAIENKDIDITFLPTVENERVIGAETLIKWIDEEGVHQNSQQVILAAERLNITNLLGYHVFDIACKQLQNWINLKPSLVDNFILSFNISKQQINDPNLIKIIKQTMEKYNIPQQMIALELSENVMCNSIVRNIKKIRQLTNLGVFVILDDFGAYHTSISHLTELPITGFKIQRNFIKKISTDDRYIHLLKSIHDIASIFNLQSTISGIETIEQYNILREQGFEIFQGFLFGHPTESNSFYRYYIESNKHLEFKNDE